MKLLELLEPNVDVLGGTAYPHISQAIELSQAISLKRIADALEAIVKLGQSPYMVTPANYTGLFKLDGTPNSILDIAGEHTGDTRRPKESL